MPKSNNLCAKECASLTLLNHDTLYLQCNGNTIHCSGLNSEWYRTEQLIHRIFQGVGLQSLRRFFFCWNSFEEECVYSPQKDLMRQRKWMICFVLLQTNSMWSFHDNRWPIITAKYICDTNCLIFSVWISVGTLLESDGEPKAISSVFL